MHELLQSLEHRIRRKALFGKLVRSSLRGLVNEYIRTLLSNYKARESLHREQDRLRYLCSRLREDRQAFMEYFRLFSEPVTKEDSEEDEEDEGKGRQELASVTRPRTSPPSGVQLLPRRTIKHELAVLETVADVLGADADFLALHIPALVSEV